MAHRESELAERVGVSRQAVNAWKLGTSRPDPDKAPAIERATDGAVTKHDLYPDLWPAP